jgi:hypothetical protein
MRFRGFALLCAGALFALGATSFANASERFASVDSGRTASVDAKTRAETPRKKVAKSARTAKADTAANDAGPLENNGELRSEKEVQPNVFEAIFGGDKPRLLPETRELDAALQVKEERKPFKVKPEFQPQSVPYSGYARGTIIIDTGQIPLPDGIVQHGAALPDRGRARRAAVQGYGHGWRQAGMAALDTDVGHAEA